MSYNPLGGGIYKITSPNGGVYIGQSWNLYDRLAHYKLGMCKQQTKLHNSIVKYGWSTHRFEVIHNLPRDVEQNVLNNYELLYYSFYRDADFKLLNIKEPNGSRGRHSEETKLKISKLRTGIKFSKEHVANMARVRTGKKQSKETIEKRRKRLLEMGHTVSAKALEAATEIKKIAVMHVESGAVYPSQKEAAQAFNCTANAIRRRLKKGIFTLYKGFN